MEGADGYITDPLNRDTDGDGTQDGAEVNAGSDPTDPNDLPSLPLVIGYWSFDDGKKPTADLSPNQNHGAVIGGATFVPGHSGRPDDLAISLDGTSGAVTTGVSLMSGLTEYTAAGWVKFTESQTSAGFFGQNDTVEFGMNSATNIHYWMAGPGAINYAFGPTSNGWRHVAIVSSTTERILYIDGDVAARGPTASPTLVTSYGFNIGGGGIYGPTGNFFKGQIDDVALWDTALTSDDITLLAGGLSPLGKASPPAQDPTITHLTFNGGTLEVTAEGMDPGATYVLRRSLDAQDFSTQVGTPFTGSETNVFVDSSLPPGTRVAFYQIWLQP